MTLFGGGSNKQAEEMKQLGENIQNLSNQIAQLKQQLNDKNSTIARLESDLAEAQTMQKGAASDDAATKKRIQDLQSQLAVAQADKEASDIIVANAQKQAAALKAQVNAAQAAQVTATSAPAVASAPAAAAGLAIGSDAWVTREGGLPLRLRHAAGLQSKIIDRLQPGTKLTLLAGPQQDDGYNWYHIRAEDGREGWVAGNDLRTQPD